VDVIGSSELPMPEIDPEGSEGTPAPKGESDLPGENIALTDGSVQELPPGESLAFQFSELPAEPDRVSHVHISLDLPEGARVRVTLEALSGSGDESGVPTKIVFEGQDSASGTFSLVHAPGFAGVVQGDSFAPASKPPSLSWQRLKDALQSWPYSLEATLFGFALALYLLTRLVGLASFPIYFFTDEAVQTVSAADLIRDHFRDQEGVFLPTYFKNGPFYNLSLSVYLQVLPYLLFGKSVLFTRGTSVLVSLLAAGSVGLILRDIFNIRYWWTGVLLLAVAPAWFLHSRTAFEVVIFVSLYTAFLYAYLLYRYRSPRYLNAAVLLAALAFYAYSPGQVVIAATALLLLFSDGRYHWENRATVLRGLALLALLALPYLRFRLQQPEAPIDHLRKLGSYWIQPLSLNEKITHYASEYLYGLSPGYWYIPNERDLPRHLMKGYGHLLRWTLPFAVLGLVQALKQLRSPAYRALVIALLLAPAGSALVQVGITRALVFIIPATLLTALGLSEALTWLEARKLSRHVLSIGVFLLLSAVSIGMLRDSLANGPTWYSDYGLGGLQYGARQLFPRIENYLESAPGTRIILSPSWANGTDVVARFFLPDPMPIQMGSVDGHLFQRLPLDDNTLFIMIPDEYERAISSGKFADIRVEQTLAYPDGRPGFYFVRIRYVEDIDEILAAERQARRVLQTAQLFLDGQQVQVKYPLLDIGEIIHMFDQNPDTLGRTLEANPAIIELDFSQPRPVSGLSITIGSTEAQITARLFPDSGAEPIEFIQVLQGTLDDPEVSLDFRNTFSVQALTIEVEDFHQEEPAHIHIWEIVLK
jgi:4-amino-4-deoxy-L-arabinose transferase-like glycosyltransferase